MNDTLPPSRRQLFAVTGLFERTEVVEQALVTLVRAGIPRDLIEVVVSPVAAKKFYGKLARSPGRAMLSYGGFGGMVGLIVGALLAFAIIALPGFQPAGTVAFVQLLGPNLTTVAGALIGAAYGATVPQRADKRHARAAENPDAIIIAVTTRTRDEAEMLAQLLASAGGQATRIEE